MVINKWVFVISRFCGILYYCAFPVPHPSGCSLYISLYENDLKRIMNIFNVKYPIRNKKSESSCPNSSFFNTFLFVIPYSLFLIFLDSYN